MRASEDVKHPALSNWSPWGECCAVSQHFVYIATFLYNFVAQNGLQNNNMCKKKKNQQPSKHTPYKTCQEANAETLKLVLYLLSFWFWLGSLSSAVAEGVAIVSFREVIL